MGGSSVVARLAAVAGSAVLVALLCTPPAHGEGCSADAQSGSNYVGGLITCTTSGSGGTSGSPSEPSLQLPERWELICTSPDDPNGTSCSPLYDCPAGTVPGWLYRLIDGNWHLVGTRCRILSDTTPTINPAAVARAFERIPLPRLRPVAQPAAKTLVNFDTIFHVEAEPLDRTLTLLGQRVELAIRPSEFRWEFGDGEVLTTTTPGAPYPSRAITHRYLDADVTVRAEVAVTWTARWRLNGGAWADVPGSVTTVGPPAVLRVVEAVPNLVATH